MPRATVRVPERRSPRLQRWAAPIFTGPRSADKSSAPMESSVGKRLAAVLAVATVIVAAANVFITDRNAALTRITEERKTCFDPKFFDQLVDDSAQRRAAAKILLGTCGFPKEDVDAILRQISVLDGQAKEGEPNSSGIPRPAIEHDALAAELRAKDLVRALAEAEDFAAAHSPEETERALTGYINVLARLSPRGKKALDPITMQEYERAMKNGATDRAVRMLSTAFEPYMKNQ